MKVSPTADAVQSPEQRAIPYHCVAVPAVGDALVLAPHADDEVFGCGGAICAHLALGHRVDVILVTDGAGQGTEPSVRRTESIAAAQVLGYGSPRFWDLPDRGLAYGEALVERIHAVVQEHDARVIYAPSPWEVHPDHLTLSLAATEAMRRLGGDRELVLYEVGATLQPNRLLDLGPYLQTKRRAMACFVSQLARQPYDRQVAALNLFRSYTLGPGVEAAEAYLAVQAEDLRRGGLPGFYRSPADQRISQGFPVDADQAPLVSVICRTMQRPELEQAATSVALQTYPNIELIVVDAAAAGLSLSPWRGRFPQRVAGGGQPLGRAAACNAGLDAARGKYCLILDEDDWIDADHIHKLVEALEHSAVHRVAYTGVAVVGRDGTATERVFAEPFDYLRLLSGNGLPVHGVLFERSFYGNGIGFDEDLDAFEDWDYWLRLARHGDFLQVDGVSAYYRQGGCSGIGADLSDEEASRHRRSPASLAIVERSVRALEPERLFQLLWDARMRADAQLTSLARLRAADLAQREALEQQHIAILQERSDLLERILNSTPWRLTAPYRWLVRQLNRIGIG